MAILLLVKKPGASAGAKVFYRDIGDYLAREQKLDIVSKCSLETIDWEAIVPNPEGDWINQRSAAFESYAAIAAKKVDDAQHTVFCLYSSGLNTARDAWVYNYSKDTVRHNAQRTIEAYNSQLDDFAEFCRDRSLADPKPAVAGFLDRDPKKISWDGSAELDFARGVRFTYDESAVVPSIYRPFSKQHVYFQTELINRVYQLPKVFPKPDHQNVGFYYVGAGTAVPFSVLMLAAVPDRHVTGAGSGGQFFPRYVYEYTKDTPDDLFSENDSVGYTRVDNITDEILADYRASYGPIVSKVDIFYYVYALLHSPDYRAKFSADLKKMLPRIPKVATSEDFNAYAEIGRELGTLHIGYESIAPYPLDEVVKSGSGTAEKDDLYRVQKMTFGKRGKMPDRSTIIYNSNVTLSGIPDEAYEYILGSRSAIEWIMERYQVKRDKPSGIINDPNDWAAEVGNPRYILDLVKRIVTVSVETMRVLRDLPPLKLTSES